MAKMPEEQLQVFVDTLIEKGGNIEFIMLYKRIVEVRSI